MHLSKWCKFLLWHVTPLKSVNLNAVNVSRNFCSPGKRKENFYATLGITKKATQGDIKSAYYKLSMEYHPDKNKGSDVAAQKFRDISEAYEVLGNLRLRKLYDKGIVHTAGTQYAHVHRDDVPEEDDPQTKFYKARMRKSEVPPATGRTPIYDFDEWSRAHYGSSFERKRAAKERFDRRANMQRSNLLTIQQEIVLWGIASFIIVFFAFVFSEAKLDSNKIKPKKES